MTDPVIIGNATLYLGDCRDILPLLPKVDAVVTDPPYGTGFVGGYNRNGDGIENDDDLVAMRECLDACQSLTEVALVFYAPRMSVEFYKETAGWPFKYQICWDKRAPGMGGLFRYQHENIAVFGDIKWQKQLFSCQSAYRSPSEHPHQKPLKLMADLISSFDAQTILDPFMGSGTTGVACAKLGRTFTGIEIDERHFNTACRRIEEAQADLFIEATPPEPTQGSFLEIADG